MICFILYICIAAVMAALLNKLWGYKQTSSQDVPKIAWVFVISTLWPATAPATIVYTLATKVVDKILKV